jgi:hypothetical protein
LTRNSSRPPPSGVTSNVPVPFAGDPSARLDDAIKR